MLKGEYRVSKITRWMDETFYPEFQNNWDDIRFRELLLTRIKPEYSCLDYGAGRGNVSYMNFREFATFVAGIDPASEVFENPFLHEAKVLPLPSGKIPYDDNSFDFIFSDNVMEHVQDPVTVFEEIRRVLKPGGTFIAKTPNQRHYMPMIARTTPIWFHRFYNRLRGREGEDTFPTEYQCNSPGIVKKTAQKTGLIPVQFQMWEGRPEYLRMFTLGYIVGLIYERFVNSSEKFSSLRCVMVFELQNPT